MYMDNDGLIIQRKYRINDNAQSLLSVQLHNISNIGLDCPLLRF